MIDSRVNFGSDFLKPSGKFSLEENEERKPGKTTRTTRGEAGFESFDLVYTEATRRRLNGRVRLPLLISMVIPAITCAGI